MLVHDDGCGGVQGLDVDEAKANARLGDKCLEAVGQIDELGGMLGRDADVRMPHTARGDHCSIRFSSWRCTCTAARRIGSGRSKSSAAGEGQVRFR